METQKGGDFMMNTQEIRKLAHQILKLYVPQEKYDYVCGIIDMAHTLGESSRNTFSCEQKIITEQNFEK